MAYDFLVVRNACVLNLPYRGHPEIHGLKRDQAVCGKGSGCGRRSVAVRGVDDGFGGYDRNRQYRRRGYCDRDRRSRSGSVVLAYRCIWNCHEVRGSFYCGKVQS